MDKSLDEIIGETKPAPAPSARRGVSKSRSRRGASAARAGAPKPMKTVVIQNLQDNISSDDLRDLFRQVGPVVRVELQRDSAGNRTGTAWVVYDFAQDALVAAERYNKRRAAGKVISVKRVARVGDTGVRTAPLDDRIGAQPLSKSQRRRQSRKNASSNKGASQPSRARNASDLDAELDAYMQVDSALPEDAPPAEEKAEESMIEV